MKQFALWSAVVCVLLSSSVASANAIEVPLHFERAADWVSSQCIASIYVADHDLLAPGAKPAPVFWDYSTSRASGLRDIHEPIIAKYQGRKYAQAGGMMFDIDDAFASKESRPELYVLVEYLDLHGPDQELTLWYEYRQGNDSDASREAKPVPFTGSMTWKKHQFHLKGVYADGNAYRNPRIRCDFRLAVAPHQRFAVYGYTSATIHSVKPADITKLPELKTKDPVFTEIPLGDVPRKVVLARSGESLSYDLAFLDENGNGDFTDDPTGKITGRVHDEERYTYVVFPQVETSVTVAGNKLPYQFVMDPRLSMRRGDSQTTVAGRMLVRSTAHLAGEAMIDGEKRSFKLVDANGSGRFGDFCSTKTLSYRLQSFPKWDSQADDLYIASDKIPLFEYNRNGLPLCRRMQLGGKTYEVEVELSPPLIRLKPYSGQLGEVTLPADVVRLVLNEQGSGESIAVYDPSSNTALPAGKYYLVNELLSRKDDQGDVWEIFAAGQPVKTFSVAVGQETKMDFGEPFTPSVTTKPSREGNHKRDLQLSLTGKSGEEFVSVTHVRGTMTNIKFDKLDARPEAPRYRILKMDGELAAEGSFEYG